MALRRSAGRGETIVLRAKMLDDGDDLAAASGLLTYIFLPDIDYGDVSLATESGVPAAFADGIYEYDYDIASDAELGIWTDVWYATLNGQTLSGIFNFEIVDAGEIVELGGQLSSNNFTDITLYAGISASDGGELADDFTSTFLTEITPAYTEGNKVRLEAGGAITAVQDDALYVAILEASLEADQLTFNKTAQNGDFFRHARREWTTCRAAATLATNARTGFYTKSKRLGDFAVEYDASALNDLLDRIAACLGRWEVQLNAGGYGTRTPRMVIKGEADPDRPNAGRMWLADDEGGYFSRNTPVSNTRGSVTGKRRWKTGYSTRWSK